MAVGVGGGEVGFDKIAVNQDAGAGFDPFVVVGVGPVVEGTGEAVADGVGVDVAAKVEQVVFVGNGFDFDGPFKNGAAVLVFEVVGFAVAVEDALGEQAGAGGVVLAGEDVVMVRQEGVGNGGDAVLAAVGFEFGEDVQVVAGGVANGKAAAAAVVEVVVGGVWSCQARGVRAVTG